MIKANELRIGNIIDFDDCSTDRVRVDYVFCDDDVWFVKWTQLTDDGWFIDGNSLLDEFKPIKLTPEILEKAGFEKPAHTYNGDIFHLAEWDEFPGCWCVAMNKNNAILVLKLKYLHQLQNLYFALTGEELTVNL